MPPDCHDQDSKPEEFHPFPAPPAPNPERLNRVRAYLLRKALGDSSPTAMLTIAISVDGRLQLDAVAIEPEHADAILGELDALRTQLQEFVSKNRVGASADIIPIRR